MFYKFEYFIKIMKMNNESTYTGTGTSAGAGVVSSRSGNGGEVAERPLESPTVKVPVVIAANTQNEGEVNVSELSSGKKVGMVVGFLAVWIVIGLMMSDRKSYFIWSGIFIGAAVLMVILSSAGMKTSTVITLISMALFIWYAWDTYKTYKDSGQEGIANTQVILMVTVLATMVITKLFLSSQKGTTEGLPEIIAVFMTVLSMIIIYLINNLSEQVCQVKGEFDIVPYLVDGSLFITIYALTGRHPVLALALSVAAFAYFTFSAKQLKDIGIDDPSAGKDGSGGQNTESTNLIVTALLMMSAIIKIVFPKFSLRSITDSKPARFVIGYLTVFSLLAFVVVNILYTSGASMGIMTGVLGALGVVLFFWKLISSWSS